MFLRNGRRERLAGRQGRAKAIEVTSRDGARQVGTAIAERAVIPARRPGTPRPQRRGVWLGAGLIAATYVLRNRRFHVALTVAVIALAALAQMGWKVLARVVADLIAWDNARLADPDKQLHRQRIAQAPDSAILEGIVIPPRQPGAASRQRNAVWLEIGLVAVTRALRNRRFDEQVIVAIFALASLSQMSWKELIRAFRDLIAWDNARRADLERQLRRERDARQASLPPADRVMPRIARIGG